LLKTKLEAIFPDHDQITAFPLDSPLVDNRRALHDFLDGDSCLVDPGESVRVRLGACDPTVRDDGSDGLEGLGNGRRGGRVRRHVLHGRTAVGAGYAGRDLHHGRQEGGRRGLRSLGGHRVFLLQQQRPRQILKLLQYQRIHLR